MSTYSPSPSSPSTSRRAGPVAPDVTPLRSRQRSGPTERPHWGPLCVVTPDSQCLPRRVVVRSRASPPGARQLGLHACRASAGAFSLVVVGWAVGSISAGAFLARREVGRKALASMLAWTIYLPGYLALAFADSVAVAMGGALLTGLGHGAAMVLATSAAQEEVPDHVLGRVMGVLSLVDRGGHATGLIFIGPLFTVFAASAVFVVAALALPLVGLAGALAALLATRRGGAARGRVARRSRRS